LVEGGGRRVTSFSFIYQSLTYNNSLITLLTAYYKCEQIPLKYTGGEFEDAKNCHQRGHMLLSKLQVPKKEEIWSEYDDLQGAIEDAFTKLGIKEEDGEEEAEEAAAAGAKGGKGKGKGR
jgi:hypothetical protein